MLNKITESIVVHFIPGLLHRLSRSELSAGSQNTTSDPSALITNWSGLLLYALFTTLTFETLLVLPIFLSSRSLLRCAPVTLSLLCHLDTLCYLLSFSEPHSYYSYFPLTPQMHVTLTGWDSPIDLLHRVGESETVKDLDLC